METSAGFVSAIRTGLLASATALLLLGCNLRSTSPSQAPATDLPQATATEEDQAVQLGLKASGIMLEPGILTYSILITNPSALEVGALSLSASGLEGLELVAAPPGSESQADGESLVWTVESLPPGTRLGPFALRAADDDSNPALVLKLAWQEPSPAETSLVIEGVEDALQSRITLPMAATSPVDVPGTGIRYSVLFGDEGSAEIARLEDDPPEGTAEGLVWLADYSIDQDRDGTILLSVPLRQPAPPFSPIHVLVDRGDGYLEQDALGTVGADGAHGSFAADGSGVYALGMDQAVHTAGMTEFEPGQGDILGSLAADGLPLIDELMGLMDQFKDLLQSLGTDGIVIIDTGDGWLVLPEPPEDDSDGACVTDATATTCEEIDGSGSQCDGHGGGVTTYYPSGNTRSVCDDGTEVITTCKDEDGDNSCSIDDADDHDPDVNFAPVPGPCPYGMCFVGDDPTQLYGVGQVDGLSTAILELIAARGLSLSERLTVDPPTVLEVQAPGPRLNAASLRAQVAMIDGAVVLLIPAEQPVHAVMAPSPLVRAGLPPAAPSPTPLPTSVPPTPLVVATTPAAKPPTPTNTPVPDTTGPSIKSFSDLPDPIKVTQPKGCTPTTSTVSAAISDASGVASVYVLFFHTTIGQLPMTNSGGNTWTATLGPYSGIGDGTADYQIHAVDTLGNASDSSFGQVTVLACIP